MGFLKYWGPPSYELLWTLENDLSQYLSYRVKLCGFEYISSSCREKFVLLKNIFSSALVAHVIKVVKNRARPRSKSWIIEHISVYMGILRDLEPRDKPKVWGMSIDRTDSRTTKNSTDSGPHEDSTHGKNLRCLKKKKNNKIPRSLSLFILTIQASHQGDRGG